MKLTRVSNAGLWVETNGLRFLLDGLHTAAVPPYCGMDPRWEAALFGPGPAADALAFTHAHPDHFDPGLAARYLCCHPQTAVYAGPDVLSALASRGVANPLFPWDAPGPLGLSAFPTRHIGPQFRDTPHASLVLNGDKRLLFAGDASPVISNFARACEGFHPDILAAPYAFVLGNAPFRVVRGVVRPEAVLVLHLPLPGQDPDGINPRAAAGAAGLETPVALMGLGETLEII